MTDNDKSTPDRVGHDSLDTAMVTVKRAADRIALTRAVALVVFTVPVIVLVPLWALAGMVATPSLHGWVRWSAMGYVLGLVAGCVITVLRTRAPREPRRPTMGELTDRAAWQYRLVTAPLVPLCTVFLVRAGLPLGWAVGVSVLGWAAFDLSMVVTYPARVTLYQVLRLAQPSGATEPESPPWP